MQKGVTVALCVVARDESAFIQQCIESARPIVDEAIVVDTGSVDGTPDLARQAGARVVEVRWPGDLGAAHNLPLAQARTDWILSLDGDELVDVSSRHLIPALIRETRRDGFRLPIRNYSYSPEIKLRLTDARDTLTAGARCYYPTQVVRLHRRHAGHFHRGRLHQSLEPSIVERGGTIGDAPVVIHHYGPLRSRDKTGLYRILARRQVQDTPRDGRAWFDLGMLFSGEKLAGALDAFHRAYELGLRAPAAFMIGSAHLECQRPREAIRWLRRSIAENPHDDSVHFDLADACETLGSACEKLGDLRQAERALTRALEHRPHSVLAANNLAGLLLERGALDRAQQVLVRLLEHTRGIAMPWSTLGLLRLRQQDLEGARCAFETAVDINPSERTALVNLALTHRLAGRRAAAAKAARTANSKAPEAAGWPDGLLAAARHVPLRRMPPGGVVTLADSVQGGPGRIIVDAIGALRGRPQIVLCANSAEYAGHFFTGEIEREGVAVRTIGSDAEGLECIEQLQPACVIDHRVRPSLADAPVRVGGERWIAVGHSATSMRRGYDAYAVLSSFHARFQRHLPRARLHRIANGVDLRRFRPRVRRKTTPVTIAMVSRLDSGRFPRQLLSYLPCLRTAGARLLIAGRGARQHEIEPELKAAGLTDVVHFVGAIASARMPVFLAAAEIGLHLTEIEQEICSVAVLEMLASGLPVVSQPKGCLPEMVSHGINGYLATEPGAIADHLARLIASPELRARMGGASRRAAQPYELERYRDRMRDLVTQTISAPASLEMGDAGVREATPDDISLHGWRPERTLLICGTRGSGEDVLCEALASTGIAGFPRPLRVPASPRRRGRKSREEFRELLRQLEECATPNGVAGVVITRPDLERLTELFAELPQLAVIRIMRRSRHQQAVARLRLDSGRQRVSKHSISRELALVADEERAWDLLLERWGGRQSTLFYEDLVTRRRQTTRSLVRQVGIATARDCNSDG